jgi:hypothetical protein
VKAELSNETKAHLKAAAGAEASMGHEKAGKESAQEAHKEVVNIITAHESAFLELGVSVHTDGNISTKSLEVMEEVNVQNINDATVGSSLQQREGLLNSPTEIETNTSTSVPATNSGTTGGIHVEIKSGSNVTLPNIPTKIDSEIKGEGKIDIGL